MVLTIAHTWDGVPLPSEEHATVRLTHWAEGLRVDVGAPFAGDPPPDHPPGPTPRLWEHEVVELFVLGPDDHYLEVELGPHGHHLVLELRGRRHIVRQGMPLLFAPLLDAEHWQGTVEIPTSWLPPRPWRGNAYRIHGLGEHRRHLAATPVPGPTPDFHRLEHFTALPL